MIRAGWSISVREGGGERARVGSPGRFMTLREFLHVLQRRKWIVLQTLLLVVAVVVAISVRQKPLYQSTSRVLLSWSNLANQLANVSSSGGGVAQNPDRLAQTQASVARTTAVAQRVL